MLELTEFDKALLNVLQGGLPISPRPFADIAQKLSDSGHAIQEQEVIDRINLLKEEGYVRRIGAFFNSDILGYRGTLVALKIKAEAIEQVAEFINQYPGITHNYEREGEYNLWFTLLTPNEAVREKIISEIKALSGVEAYMDLSARKKYKINVQFKLK